MNLRTMFAAFVFGLTAPLAQAERTLEHEAVIAAPVADVWNAWTTNEGFASWAVAKAEIDLRIGGEMRTSYNPQSTLHDEHTIVNRIISFQPQRMLSIRNEQAPAGFKNPELFQSTWTVIYFEPLASQQTRIRCVGMGYGEGPAWDDIFAKFKAGNQWTLDKLREKFASGQVNQHNDADQVLTVLARQVGGDWIHENTLPDGKVFRARTMMEFAPDGRSLCAKGWLSGSGGMMPHTSMQIWREPAVAKGGPAGPVRFQGINEHGAVARGEIRLGGPSQLEWDWLATETNGEAVRYHITTTVEDENHYRFRLMLPDQTGAGGEPRELVNIVYTRVQELPAAFTMVGSSH